MRRLDALAVLLIGLCAPLSAEGGEEPSGRVCDLTLIVEGLKDDEGEVMVALANSKEDYKGDEPFRGAAVAIRERRAIHTFAAVPFGDYAIKLFHDRNDNERLDTNFLGIPKESYGFSNNVMGRFGPPSWEKARFSIDSRLDTLVVRTR